MAFVSCKRLTYAKYTSGGDGSAVVYAGGKMLSDYLCKVDQGENRDEVKEYADGHLIDSEKQLQNVTVNFELANSDKNIRGDILGHVTEGSGASAFKRINDADPPFTGVGFVLANRFKGTVTYEAWWYYKTQFTSAGVSVNTRKENTEFQHETINGVGAGVKFTDSDEHFSYVDYVDELETEAAAVAWLKTKAGIQS